MIVLPLLNPKHNDRFWKKCVPVAKIPRRVEAQRPRRSSVHLAEDMMKRMRGDTARVRATRRPDRYAAVLVGRRREDVG